MAGQPSILRRAQHRAELYCFLSELRGLVQCRAFENLPGGARSSPSNDVAGTTRVVPLRSGDGSVAVVGVGRYALLHLDDFDLHVELAQPG